MTHPPVDYWPAESDFDNPDDWEAFFAALCEFETSGNRDMLARFLMSMAERGKSLSPGVTRTLAHLIGGGVAWNFVPESPRAHVFVVKDVDLSRVKHEAELEERDWQAATEVRRLLAAGVKRSDAIKHVAAKEKMRPERLRHALALQDALGFKPVPRAKAGRKPSKPKQTQAKK